MPGEWSNATQPYSVEMPTVGVERLTEKMMWGAIPLDQLACRISFKKLRYDGDFTPPGLQRAIQQPGNVGGMNWGSVSVDPHNQRVFLNDIRVPSAFQLVPRADYRPVFAGYAADINDAYRLLAPVLGVSLASIVFGVALLASGQNSTLTGTLAGQIVMEGFLNIRLAPWLRRLITRLIAVVPAMKSSFDRASGSSTKIREKWLVTPTGRIRSMSG